MKKGNRNRTDDEFGTEKAWRRYKSDKQILSNVKRTKKISKQLRIEMRREVTANNY